MNISVIVENDEYYGRGWRKDNLRCSFDYVCLVCRKYQEYKFPFKQYYRLNSEKTIAYVSSTCSKKCDRRWHQYYYKYFTDFHPMKYVNPNI